ncbi:MAG: membrane dipeptidase [Thermodesulfobacteriota bacterium]
MLHHEPRIDHHPASLRPWPFEAETVPFSRAEWRNLNQFHYKSLVYDLHFHPRSGLPALVRHLSPRIFRRTMPALEGLAALPRGGVDGCVLAAVGDRQVTGPFSVEAVRRSVSRQLARIRAEIEECGGRIATTAAGIRAAKAAGKLSFVLGLEGADGVRHPEDLDDLYAQGVRLLSPVHLHDNALGTVGATNWNYWLGGRQREDLGGLTALGEKVVRRMNRLGMIIDVSHASRRLLLDITALTSQPVVASHSGARAVFDFHRYLRDDEIRAVAATGGIIGLWPMYYLGRGMAEAKDFQTHLRHVADLVGVDHLAIGTDLQGIPGVMAGYGGVTQQIYLTRLLFEAGLDDTQAAQVLGLNFLRVFGQVNGG